MGLSNADVLAIRATMQNVQRVRSDLRYIRQDLRDIRSENQRTASSQRSLALAVTRGFDQAARGGARAVAQTRALNREAQTLRGTFSSLRGLVASIGIPFGVAGIAKLGLMSVQKLEGKQGAGRAFAFNFGQAVSRQVMSELDRFADRQGLSRVSARRTGLGLAGSGNIRPDELVALIRSFTALGAVGGANSEQQSRAFEQLTQIASQGKLQGDELRQIAENLVPLRTLIIRAGLGARIGSQTDPISFREVADVLLKFGKSGDVAAMLAAQAQNATSSLQRLYNVVEDELAPAIGEAVSPALKELAEVATDFAKALDPEEVKRRVRQIIGFGKTIVDNAPAILGIYIGAKLANVRLSASAWGAAAALDAVAGSAYAAAGGRGVTGALGGMAGAGGRGSGSSGVGVGAALPRATAGGSSPVGVLYGPGGTKTFLSPSGKATSARSGRGGGVGSTIGRGAKAVGRGVVGGVGAIGGGLAGQKVGEAVSDNPLVQILFSILGSVGGSALAAKLMSGGAAAGIGGAAKAVGAGAVGAAGTVGTGGLLLGLGALLEAAVIGHAEGMFYGYQDDRTVAVQLMKRIYRPAQFGAGAKGEGNRAAILKANQARQEARRFLGKKMPWLTKNGGAISMDTLLDYAWMLPIQLQKALVQNLPGFGAAYSARHSPGASPRAAAYDSRSAEQDSRSIRWTF